MKLVFGNSNVAPTEITDADPFDLATVRPISNLPPGAKVKLRMRVGRIVEAFVKHEGAISHWLLWNDDHGGWMLKWIIGQNVTVSERKEGK